MKPVKARKQSLSGIDCRGVIDYNPVEMDTTP
jgi:hypothetical protein